MTDRPGKGRSALSSRPAFCFLTSSIAWDSTVYWSLYCFASSSALALSRLARTLRLISSMLSIERSSSSVDSIFSSAGVFSAALRFSLRVSRSFLRSLIARSYASIAFSFFSRSERILSYSRAHCCRWPFLAKISCCSLISSEALTGSSGASG